MQKLGTGQRAQKMKIDLKIHKQKSKPLIKLNSSVER